jgi:DNA anti-recombination protein RmuC
VENQREDAVVQMKDLNDERISNVLRTNQNLLRSADRESKSQVNLMNARHREDRETILTNAQDQKVQVSNQAESRVRKVIDLQNKNNEQMGRYYTDSLDTMKGNYLEKMDQSREENLNERISLSKEMTQRFRNLEGNFNNKLEQTVKSYETKLSDLKDTQARELKRLETVYAQRVSDRDKMARLEKESVTQKYEAKIVQSNESHTDQLDRMNRRHQEDMQNLAVKVNSYNRKA